MLVNHTSVPVWENYRQVLSNSFFILFRAELMALQEREEEYKHDNIFLSSVLIRDRDGTSDLRSYKEIHGAFCPQITRSMQNILTVLKAHTHLFGSFSAALR